MESRKYIMVMQCNVVLTRIVFSLQLPICWLYHCCRPVEENEDFLTDLEKAAGGKGVILMCEAGGTMKASANFASGKASRSLKVRAAAALRRLCIRRAIFGGSFCTKSAC